MDKLRNRLNILLIAYDHIANAHNNETVIAQVNNIKGSIKELDETLNLLNKISNK